jgi:TnpA family transposase
MQRAPRAVIPSANTGPSPHYFGQGRGVTYLNYTSDQFTGLGGLVIPGTIRDSVYVLEALLEQESGLMPIEIMSDTASYSDLMFGLFWCLRYQFSPRLAEMKETRFWRTFCSNCGQTPICGESGKGLFVPQSFLW